MNKYILKFTYKNHLVEIEETQEYVWLPIRYCFSIDGRYEFKLTVKPSNRKLLKFSSARQAENAARRHIDAGFDDPIITCEGQWG